VPYKKYKSQKRPTTQYNLKKGYIGVTQGTLFGVKAIG
jgi:hypothetical protein